MRAKRMKARNQTNPNLLQLSIIAKRTEWEVLCKVLDKASQDNNEIINDFNDILGGVVVDGEQEVDSRNLIDAGDNQRSSE